MSTPSLSPGDDRRKLIGSWLDWIDRLPHDFTPHRLRFPELLQTVCGVQRVTAAFGLDSPVAHRAQAAFLAAADPKELFEILTLAADAAQVGGDE